MREEFIIPSLERLEGDDKIRGGGLFVLARAGVFVVGPQTHDEVTELVRAIPAWAAWGRSVAPLERFANRAELEKKIVRGLRSQGKMMDNRRRLCRTRQASQF